MADFTEREMADVVVAHADHLLGEPLTLLDRNVWIGRYELDLLFSDRHGAKLIVELQRGALDRYHLYKVLDYYDEYRTRHPDEFVEVLVVANLISPERKERLAKRGINFREIPDSVIRGYLQPTGESPQPEPSKQAPRSVTARLRARAAKMVPEAPAWFTDFLQTIDPRIRQGIDQIPAFFQPFDDPDPWTVTAAVATFWQRLLDERSNRSTSQIFALVTASFAHLYANLLLSRLGQSFPEVIEQMMNGFDPQLLDFLRLGETEPTPLQFFLKRHALMQALAKRCAADPPALRTLCAALRLIWINCPADAPEGLVQAFLELLGVCLGTVVREVSETQWKGDRVPIGIDKEQRFITRPRLVNHKDLDHFYIHTSVVLSLPSPVAVKLWSDEEPLLHEYVDDAFPVLAEGFRIGSELLVHAYGNRAYVVDQPSAVVINSGEITSIVVAEVPEHGVDYRILYKNGGFSLGHVRLEQTGDTFKCEHVSTHTILGFLTFSTSGTVTDQVRQRSVSGHEFALVAAIVRDFLVCQEKETYYTGNGGAKTPRKAHAGHIIIRYLPRFRVRYIGIRSTDYQERRVEVTGHHVTGHLRQCRMASPGQLAMARQFGIFVPDGFTFVRPHDRGGHAKTLYRSRSALQLLYS